MTQSVEDLIQELEERFPRYLYLYRGQSMIYPGQENWVPSTLARILPAGEVEGLFALEKKILCGAASFYSPHTQNIEIMADLRHLHGPANLIDFTRDIRIALFFACLEEPEQDGKLFFLRTKRGRFSYGWGRRFSSSDKSQAGDIRIFRDFHISSNAKRAIRQSGVLVRPQSGHIDFKEEEETHVIPKELKEAILKYLASQQPPIELHYLFSDKTGFTGLGKEAPKSHDDFEKNLDDLLKYREKQLLGGDYYSQGREYFFRGDYDVAANLFRAALGKAGRSSLGDDIYRYLSSALLRTGKHQDALDMLARIPYGNRAGEDYCMYALGRKGLKDFSRARLDIAQAVTDNRFRSFYYITEMQIARRSDEDRALRLARWRNYSKLFRSIRGEKSPLGEDDF